VVYGYSEGVCSIVNCDYFFSNNCFSFGINVSLGVSSLFLNGQTDIVALCVLNNKLCGGASAAVAFY